MLRIISTNIARPISGKSSGIHRLICLPQTHGARPESSSVSLFSLNARRTSAKRQDTQGYSWLQSPKSPRSERVVPPKLLLGDEPVLNRSTAAGSPVTTGFIAFTRVSNNFGGTRKGLPDDPVSPIILQLEYYWNLDGVS